VSDIDNLLKEGIAALKAGQRIRARALLQEVVREQPDNVAAWLWLSGAVETDDERRECLERVLEVDPNNPHAKKGLERLGPRTARKLSAPMAVITEKPHPPSKMQTCPHCGLTVQGQHKFCTVCGRALTVPTITTAYPPRSELLDREKALPGAAPRREKRKKRTKGKLSGWQAAAIAMVVVLVVGCAFAFFLLLIDISVPASVSPSLGTQTPTDIPKATKTSAPMEVKRWEGVYIGMPADDVLRIHPKSEMNEDSVVLRNDSKGLVIRWSYPGAYLTFARREGEGTDSLGFSECYRVIEIQLR